MNTNSCGNIRYGSYTLQIRPVPLRRHRHGRRRDGRVIGYDDQKNTKMYLAALLKKQHGNKPLFQGNIKLDITFAFKNIKKNNQYHTKRPDLSNLIKIIEDVAIGVLYKDDSIICSISAKKIYKEYDQISFTLTEVENGTN